VAKLVRIPGVGKKTAERIVLELKDKLPGDEAISQGAPVNDAVSGWNSVDRDVLSALQNLGCSRAAAEEAVRKTKQKGAPDEFEAFFRTALAAVR